MKLPDMPRDGVPVSKTVIEIINYLRASRLVNIVGGRMMGSSNGTTLVLKPGGKPSKTATVAQSCPFGKIVTTTEGETTTTAILGGIIHCGDQNWSMDNQELNLAASGTWLVSISVSLEVNRDDDGEILLPGVKTGTKPTGDWTKTVWTTGADYPDNTAPSASTGNGTVVLPIGKLTIADGAATLEPAGCGNFTITHCAGTLGYSRA